MGDEQRDTKGQASGRRSWLPRRLPAALLLALGMSAAGGAPARATTTVNQTNSPFVVNDFILDDFVVEAGGELDLVTGGSIRGLSATAVTVNGGTFNISGGALAADIRQMENGTGVAVKGGTVNISGGSLTEDSISLDVQGGMVIVSGGLVRNIQVHGGAASISGGVVGELGVSAGTASVSGGVVSGISVDGGTATISGGSIVDNPVSPGLFVGSGTLTVMGCNLTLSSAGQLTGILTDGTPINIPTSGAGALVLVNQCASILAALVQQFVTDPPVAQSLLAKLNAIANARTPTAKAGVVGAFIQEVKAQTGKSIAPAQAAILIQTVMML